MSQAVVLGGGLAGVLVASALAGYFDRITVVESGSYPAGPVARPGLPQAYHSHVLVTGGEQALEELLPGIVAELLAHGAERRGLSSGTLMLNSDGWLRRCTTGSGLLSCSRWLLDHVVRSRALADGAISVRESTVVQGLAGDASGIAGVLVRNSDGRSETIRADLVIDATGRRSRAAQWLAELGGPAVTEETIDSGLAYATRFYQAPQALSTEMPAVVIHPAATPGRPDRGGTLYPIEGGRWVVTLTGTRGGEPPVDDRGFEEFARYLRSPVIAELMAAAVPLGPARPYRNTANRRRYFERASLPGGFLVVGDALSSLNPLYSHGMTVAALSALRLRAELVPGQPVPTGLQAAMAAVADRPWRMATSKDRRQAEDGAAGQRQATVFERSVRAGQAAKLLNSQVLMTEFFRIQTLNRQPAADGATLFQAMAGDAGQPLDENEAIAQYPQLARWWFSDRQRPVGVAI
ncbi:MAG TPA: FAD-dependent monooxygenase [Jatrophihabitans sp.]|nr:FAD-dependent monooxygenase [Jatrophihabitans sp.]